MFPSTVVMALKASVVDIRASTTTASFDGLCWLRSVRDLPSATKNDRGL